MNQPLRIAVLVIAFMLVCFTASYAADIPKAGSQNKGYDKYGRPLPGAAASTIVEKPPLPVKPQPCTDYGLYAARVDYHNQQIYKDGRWACPPGYGCGPGQQIMVQNPMGGTVSPNQLITSGERLCHRTYMLLGMDADDPACHWTGCAQ